MEPTGGEVQLHRVLIDCAEEAITQAAGWAERLAAREGAVASIRLLVGHDDPSLVLLIVDRWADDRALPPSDSGASLIGDLSSTTDQQLDLSAYDATPPHLIKATAAYRAGREAEGASVAAVAFLRIPPEQADEFQLVERAYMSGPVGELPGFAGSVLYRDADDPRWFVSVSRWQDRAAWIAALADHAAMLDAMVVLADDVRVFEFEAVWEFQRRN